MWLQGLLLCLVIELHGISYGQFSGTNIALNKSATQKPDTYCARNLDICYNASKAVDGELEPTGHLNNGYCTHTIEQYETAASWSVDFGASYYINGIRVHNRKSIDNVYPPIGSRLRNFTLYGTTPEQQNGSLLYTYNYIFIDNNYPDVVEIPLPEKPYYSGIRIEIPYRGKDEHTILTLCEVEVYSVICGLNNDSARTVMLSDNLNNGSTANFSCNVGFYLSSNYSLLCINGNWSRDPPTCLGVFCPKPSLQHGRYQTSSNCSSMLFNESLPFNCTIEAQCDKGYFLIDGGTKVCTQSGDWSELRSVCQLANCSLPKDTIGKHYVFTNGSEIMGDIVLYGTNITVKCNPGYKLNGKKENITCLENNSWTNQSHECILVTCEHPENDSIINGSFQDGAGNAYTEGQKNYSENIFIHCVEGYTPASGSNVIKCQEDGHWDNLPTACVAVTCAALEVTSGLTYEYSDQDTIKTSPYNSTVRISCVNEPETTQVRICSQTGHWNGNSPVCGTMVKTDAVIGGAVAGGVVLLLIIILLLIVLKRRGVFQRKKSVKSNHSFKSIEGKPEQTSTDGGYQEIKEVNISVENKDVVYQNTPASPNNVNYEFVNDSNQNLPKTAILVKDLSDLVFTGGSTEEKFHKEFEKLPDAESSRYSEAMKFKNKGKNRYRGLYAYDDTRVVLDVETKGETDYINACFVNGFKLKKKFIASQGPTTDIIPDFWRMIWQTKCRKIVMLTNLTELGKSKCDQYWPDEGCKEYGNISVTIKETDAYTDFIIRKFSVKRVDSHPRHVTQFHFTAWPDKGVPKYASSLVHFRHKVKYTEKQSKEPVIVHCSAGVGRTGTFIALDYITEQAKELGYVDVYGCVESLRKQRARLVQTLEQYIFLHHTVVETLMLSSSALPSSKFQEAYQRLLEVDTKTKKRKIDVEFETLKKLSPVIPEDQYVSAKAVQNRLKNRYSNILPVAEFMPRLSSDSTVDNYINAVFLPSYKNKEAFIITQTPLETTKTDFWKLVWQHDIRTVVMMNHLQEMKEGEVYWPEADEKLQFDDISITTENKRTEEQHTVIHMTAGALSSTRSLWLIQCGGWEPNRSLPDSTQVVLSLMDLVETWQRQSGNHTVLVHCMNGADRSGLFCVVSAVIERMKIEQTVAISQVIEEMRNAREQIIPTVDHYRFCHDAVLAYIQMNDTYSNFMF